MPMRSLTHVSLHQQRVLLRADLNLPCHEGRFSDLTRLERLVPTVAFLLERGARVLVLSHRGRPKGVDLHLSLAPVAPLLAECVGEPVRFIPDCVGPRVAEALADGPERLFLLENLRFYPGEEANDPAFAQALAAHGDLFVNDGFSVSHRAHASVVGLGQYLPSYPGLHMIAELEALDGALTHPVRPLAALVGGSKISTKIELLQHLVTQVDCLMIGGAMANTFLKATGLDLGASLVEEGCEALVASIHARAETSGCQILLPTDGRGGVDLKASPSKSLLFGRMGPEEKIFDLGPETVTTFTQALEQARTLIWNGPLGVFEVPPYDAGTTAVAKHVAHLTQEGRLLSLGGGGDTVSALAHAGVMEELTYISTAGGAFLEWMEGKVLPGVEALLT